MNPKRRAIWAKTNGVCWYCGTTLDERNWHADHVEPLRRNWWTNTSLNPENEREDNKVPACPSCNIQKGSLSVEQFRDKITQYIRSLNEYSNQYKMAKKYGLVTETGAEVRFWYEDNVKEGYEYDEEATEN